MHRIISVPNTSLLLRIICAFWLIAKLISYKVWLTSRLFPLVPVFNFLENIPPIIHLLLYIVSIISLVCIIVFPGKRMIYIVLMAAEIAALLLDYTRWQPWEYQYLFILFIFLFNKDKKNIIAALSFMMAALYFYSGIHKLNDGFLLQVWNNMILMSFLKIPHAIRANELLFNLGYCIGILELLTGIALMMRRTQKIAAILLISMHVFNLVWLGPVGMNYNIIVWPWNCLMIIILYKLFLKNRNANFSIKRFLKPANFVVLVFLGVLPFFNQFGFWDNYLSGSLYSGNLPLMAICTDAESAKADFKDYIKHNDLNNICDCKSLIKLQSWAMNELNVPPYPEIRVYRKIEKQIIEKYPKTSCYLYY